MSGNKHSLSPFLSTNCWPSAMCRGVSCSTSLVMKGAAVSLRVSSKALSVRNQRKMPHL